MAQTDQPALVNRDFPVSDEVSSCIGHQRSPPTPLCVPRTLRLRCLDSELGWSEEPHKERTYGSTLSLTAGRILEAGETFEVCKLSEPSL